MRRSDTRRTAKPKPDAPERAEGADANGRRTLVVVGNGMVGHKLLEELVERGATAEWDIVTFCEESRPAYDRVNLSSFFSGTTAEDLSLVSPGFFVQVGLTVHLGDKVAAIDTKAGQVVSARGARIAYDALVLATGSFPFVPPVTGSGAAGCFVYRTIDDLEAIREWAAGCRTGAVVGGGLLGLEAANALKSLGLETHVVEFAPRLMGVQVDDGGAAALRRRIEDLGVHVHTSMSTKEILVGSDGQVTGMHFGPMGDPGPDDAEAPSDLPVDMVVFSAGIRPRDELAKAAGLTMGERGGVIVDDACRTSDPRIYAIGECALAPAAPADPDGNFARRRIYGLVSPGYQMARVVADRILGGDASFTGADMSTKLKLLGIDVASFGDGFGTTAGSESITYSDPVSNVYKRLVVGPPVESTSKRGGPPTRQVLGGILVGDAAMYQTLLQMSRGDMPTPEHPEQLIFPAPVGGGGPTVGVGSLSAEATICSCNNVSKGAICAAIAEGLTEMGPLKAATKAGTGCGGCVPLATELLRYELKQAGVEVKNHLCEHFAYSRQELFDVVRVHRLSTFSDVVAGHGTGRGCEICKPAVASMLAALGNGYILDGEQASLQDTNDHFLANLQRDGTYSVIPRVPGGEITPDQLIAIGSIAKDFGLYTKITGAQRIDMFGARVDQLPHIWKRLVDVGMESGHAYGKALRTVKSCVGTTWCRFGVQDSVGLAVELELRYRGLRAPHKLKSAVSGCTRECAEAQSKDFGVIATERGWNVYVCGNGGMKPQHAVLLASDLDKDTVVRYLDRYLMFYIRTADRLERTAVWFNKLEGGIEHLRRVIIDDALGICDELEAEMARHVETYECEWKATIESPERMRRFRTFVNSDDVDPNVVFVTERGQPRPAFADEKPDPELLANGASNGHGPHSQP